MKRTSLSLFKETKGPLYGGPFPFACEQCKQHFFKSSCKSTNRSLHCFLQPTRLGITEKRPGGRAGPFPRIASAQQRPCFQRPGGQPRPCQPTFPPRLHPNARPDLPLAQ